MGGLALATRWGGVAPVTRGGRQRSRHGGAAHATPPGFCHDGAVRRPEREMWGSKSRTGDCLCVTGPLLVHGWLGMCTGPMRDRGWVGRCQRSGGPRNFVGPDPVDARSWSEGSAHPTSPSLAMPPSMSLPWHHLRHNSEQICCKAPGVGGEPVRNGRAISSTIESPEGFCWC